MIGPEITVPDVTEAVVGYRQFCLEQHTQHNYRLVSPHQREPWPKAEMRAVCRREIRVPDGIVLPFPPKPHSAPAKDCGCGIYAYFDPCPVGPRPRDHYSSFLDNRESGTRISCLVSLSGRLEVHAGGMRAERGRVCALGLNERLTAYEQAALREIARRFDAAVVDERELGRIATEYGSPLGAAMRPESPPKPELPCVPEAPTAITWSEPQRPSRWEHLPTAINAVAGATNGTIIALSGPSPLNVASCGFSLAMAAFFEAKRRRRSPR